jgi:chaperonin GroEL
VASLMLTTDCAVCEAPKDEAAAPAMPGGMDMGGMGGMM